MKGLDSYLYQGLPSSLAGWHQNDTSFEDADAVIDTKPEKFAESEAVTQNMTHKLIYPSASIALVSLLIRKQTEVSLTEEGMLIDRNIKLE